MTDKGKAVMSPEEVARQERKAWVQERVRQWIESADLGPPYFLPKHPEPHHPGHGQAGPSHRGLPEPEPEPRLEPRRIYYFGRTPEEPSYPDLRDPDSPEYTPSSPHQASNVIPDGPDSPYYTPASPMPEPYVVTDLVPEKVLEECWEKTARPIPPDLGPWFRFVDGFIRFRYGTTWAEIDRQEREAAWERRFARNRGEEAEDIPPPHRPGEILFRIEEGPDTPPMAQQVPPVQDPPVEEDEPMEPIDPVNDVAIEPMDDDPIELSDSEDSSEDEEEEELRAWSDTSTVTEEPSMIPSAFRRPIWARRVGARRT